VWGDGTAILVFTYVDDLVDGIYTLMHSDLEGPVNPIWPLMLWGKVREIPLSCVDR